jgi:hypothetical protein
MALVGTLTDIRRAIAAAIAPAVGGRVYASMLDQLPIGPPIAVVVIDPGDAVIERLDFPGAVRYSLRVRVIVGGQSDESRQEQLDALISPGNPVSVWSLLETPSALAGVADSCTVTQVTGYGQYGDDQVTAHLAAELMVEVMQS